MIEWFDVVLPYRWIKEPRFQESGMTDIELKQVMQGCKQ